MPKLSDRAFRRQNYGASQPDAFSAEASKQQAVLAVPLFISIRIAYRYRPTQRHPTQHLSTLGRLTAKDSPKHSLIELILRNDPQLNYFRRPSTDTPSILTTSHQTTRLFSPPIVWEDSQPQVTNTGRRDSAFVLRSLFAFGSL